MVESRCRSSGADYDDSFARLELVTLVLHGREMTPSALHELGQVAKRDSQIWIKTIANKY